MFVRALTIEDGDAVWALRLRALADDPEAFGTTVDEAAEWGSEALLRRLRKSDDERFYLGAFNGTLAGMVYFERVEGTKDRHKAEIASLYVVPERRGLGVGRALMEEVIARAERLPGLEQLRLAVVTTNAAAIALYRSLGFRVYGTDPRTLKLGERYWDEDLMMLDIR